MPNNDKEGSERIDVADLTNRRIWDFVHQPANLSLRPGTGYYSTLFRGGLFGQFKAADVAKQSSTRRVDVLWLGTNPCVPGSLNKIINPPSDSGDFPSFERQIESGFFGSSKWGPDGNPEADFNPIEAPKNGWKVYRDLFEQIGRLDCVAMANFIPWGSQDMQSLVAQLGNANRPMLQRMVEFADDLNAQIIQALAPKLLVVPFSLGRNSDLDALGCLGISLKKAVQAIPFSLSLPRGTFNFHIAMCQRGKLTVHALFVPHPAALRLSNESKTRVVSEVAQALRDLQ